MWHIKVPLRVKRPLISYSKLTPMMYSWVSATTEENSTSTVWGSSEMMAAATLSHSCCSSGFITCSGFCMAEHPPDTQHTHNISDKKFGFFQTLWLYTQNSLTICCVAYMTIFMLPFARKWRLSVPCSANPRSHLEHLKGFSPVWWRMWRTRAPFSRNAREQCGHTYGFSWPCVRWCTWSAFWNEKGPVKPKHLLAFVFYFYTKLYLHVKTAAIRY